MRFDVISIFPEAFPGPLGHGVIGRARQRGLVELAVHDLRDFADPPRRDVDDQPFGGGVGMVFRPEPLARALAALRGDGLAVAVVLPSPAGEVLTPSLALELAEYDQVLLPCDRYEGADARLAALVTHEVCVGDVVLTGAEVAAMVIVDAVARLLPGVVGDPDSVTQDSFAAGMLDHRAFTRPAEYLGQGVPRVLTSGDHEKVRRWRRQDALRRTLERRPDLLQARPLSRAERSEMMELRGAAEPAGAASPRRAAPAAAAAGRAG